ncbi:hypothetical protein SHJG_1612 [Streptomyces hygroscopicus subsp. jinggangensis 5008]|nr:hypothetical protein SHJG_1612 [Streptomyces hygroscopicus subsp. jinggangensis 5008]
MAAGGPAGVGPSAGGRRGRDPAPHPPSSREPGTSNGSSPPAGACPGPDTASPGRRRSVDGPGPARCRSGLQSSGRSRHGAHRGGRRLARVRAGCPRRPGPPRPFARRSPRPVRGGAASRPRSRSGRPAGRGRRTARPRRPSPSPSRRSRSACRARRRSGQPPRHQEADHACTRRARGLDPGGWSEGSGASEMTENSSNRRSNAGVGVADFPDDLVRTHAAWNATHQALAAPRPGNTAALRRRLLLLSVRLWRHPYWQRIPSVPAARSELRQPARARGAVQAALPGASGGREHEVATRAAPICCAGGCAKGVASTVARPGGTPPCSRR